MKISATTWNAVSTLLDEALDLPPAARATWLDRLTHTQPDLAPSLRELLAAHATHETADVLARLPTLAGVPAEGAQSQQPGLGLTVGELVGPYRLTRELGSGGMADVWLAARADGAFVRDVALKIPRISRLRSDLAIRFARERDILARLEHPHIARLYDAGVADDGLPYLAMEFVDGQPITAYCDTQRLDIAARLALFSQVLDAVQFAHANLIIHRDLKPSNILVGHDGQVRLLDFGIAKLLTDGDGASAHETQLTQSVGRALTPDYASPEQIIGAPLTIASDVYSLGVVLYELLTGNRPYKLKVKSAAQLELAILESVSAPPSTNIALATTPARRVTARQLTRLLVGDLDTITLKALAKRPGDRYATIAAFADDLHRYFDGSPVMAIAPSRWYRARKFVVRNRLAVGAASAVGVALFAAATVSWWQAQIARDQAKVAQRESKRAGAVQNFLLDIFRANSDQQKDPVKARNTTARELLDIGAARVARNLQDVPEAQDDVLNTLAEMYFAVGLDDAGATMVRQRVETRKKLYGANDPRVAEALIELAQSVQSTTDKQQASALLAEAKVIVDARPDTPEYVRSGLLVGLARAGMYTAVMQTRDYAHEAARLMQLPNAKRDELASAWNLEARASNWLGDGNAATRLHEQSIAEAKKSDPEAFSLVLTNTVELAEVHARGTRVAVAEKLYRDILVESRRRNGENHVDTLHVETRLASFLHDTSRRVEARAIREALQRKIELGEGGGTPNFTGIVRRNAAASLFNEGRFDDAALLMSINLELRRQLYPNSITLATAVLNMALLSTEIGRYEEAGALLDEAEKMQQAALGSAAAPITRNRFLLARARLQIVTGLAEQAINTLNAVTLPGSAATGLSLDRVRTNNLRASANLKPNRVDAAMACARAALDELIGSSERDYYQTLEADAQLQLGESLFRGGGMAAARIALERALLLRKANDDLQSPWIAEAEVALAACLAALGENAKSRAMLAQAFNRNAAHKQLGAHFTQPPLNARSQLGAAKKLKASMRPARPA